MSKQTKNDSLTYDLHELEEQAELRAAGVARPFITLTATDDKGRSVSITTNGVGDGIFHRDSTGGMIQDAGTTQMHIYTRAFAKKVLRQAYDIESKCFID